MIRANNTVVIPGKFLTKLSKKRSEMVKGDWIFQWNNATVHTAAIVKIGRPPQSNSGGAAGPQLT
jgi:predicted acetyltransferase